MRTILLLFVFSITSLSFSQDTITSAQAKDYIGREVILKGRVSSYRLASEGKSTNLINIDSAYPNHIFTIVVSNQYLEAKNINLESLKGKFILVKGTVSTYDKDPKKIPQIFNPTVFELK